METVSWQKEPLLPHYNLVLQTIVTDFSLSTELLVSGLITSKGCSACRMGVTADTLPETLCQGEPDLLAQMQCSRVSSHWRYQHFLLHNLRLWCTAIKWHNLTPLHSYQPFKCYEGDNWLGNTQHFCSRWLLYSMIYSKINTRSCLYSSDYIDLIGRSHSCKYEVYFLLGSTVDKKCLRALATPHGKGKGWGRIERARGDYKDACAVGDLPLPPSPYHD